MITYLLSLQNFDYNSPMSKKEKIKAMLDFYKSLILALLTALFGVLGYTFINYEKYSLENTYIVIAVVVFLLITIAILIKSFLKEVNKLEKEKE